MICNNAATLHLHRSSAGKRTIKGLSPRKRSGQLAGPGCCDTSHHEFGTF